MSFHCWQPNLGNAFAEPLPSIGHMRHNNLYTRMTVANPGPQMRSLWKTTSWSANKNKRISFLSFTLRRLRESDVWRLVERWICPLPWTGSWKAKKRCGVQSVLVRELNLRKTLKLSLSGGEKAFLTRILFWRKKWAYDITMLSVCLHICVQFLNQLLDFHEIWNEPYAIGDHPNTVIFNLLQRAVNI
jgi:hypothetical protein